MKIKRFLLLSVAIGLTLATRATARCDYELVQYQNLLEYGQYPFIMTPEPGGMYLRLVNKVSN